MRTRLHIFACLVLAVLAACTPARREVEGSIARRIRFEGNGGPFSGHNDLQLRGQMEHDHTAFGVLLFPLNLFVDPVALEPEILPRDAYRLEMWYAHNGWFEARVDGWQLIRVRRETARRAGVVDIVGMVEPGRPSLIRNYEITGLDRYTTPLANHLRRTGPLQEGDQFNLETVYHTRQLLTELLHNQSRAYASVSVQMEAHPEDHVVDVSYAVAPGLSAVYGPISVSGYRRIREHHIRQVLPFEEGEAYRLDELRDARQRLFRMGTFSLVTVEPDLSDPTNPDVPIQVSVTESRFRTLRFGAGIQLESGIPRPRLSTQFRHVNLFNQLIRMDLEGAAGAAIILSEDADGIQQIHPTFLAGASFTYPRIMGQRLALELRSRVVQDVQANLWLYRQPQADLHAVWTGRLARSWHRDDFMLRLGPHVEEYRYLDLSPATEQAARRLFGTGTEFLNPYQLTALDQHFTLDWRDDPLRTTRGTYLQVRLREALPLTPNGFFFGSAMVEGRIFRPLSLGRRGSSDFPVVGAGRLRGQYMHPFGDRGIPYPELTFLGGPNSIRGFRARQVGPYDTLCSYTPGSDDPQRFHLPRGGTAAVEGTAELRYLAAWGLTVAGFFDAGILERDLTELGMEDLRWSVGTGIRYDTVIGPIRFDLSFRRLYPEDEGPHSFVNCRHPEHQVPRSFDVFSSFPAIRDGRVGRPPFATVFYIAIGEAL